MTEAEKLLQETKSAVVAETQTEDICVIDSDLRIIDIPEQFKVLGVENDKDVKVMQFRMPKVYKGTDLSAFNISVNYQNARGTKDRYVVTDKKVSGDQIEFSWTVGKTATVYRGDTRFIVCMRLTGSDGIIQKEFNTTLATMTVLEGLEVDNPVIEQEEKDIIAQLLQIVDDKSKEAVQAVTAEGTKQIKAVQAEAQEIAADREQIKTNKADIADLMQTKAGAIINSAKGERIAVGDSAGAFFEGLKLYGKTEQVQTKGYQLFDASEVKPASMGGATVTANSDGSYTVSGTGCLTKDFWIGGGYSHDEVMKLFKVGKLTVSAKATMPRVYFSLSGSKGKHFEIYAGETVNITKEMLEDTNLSAGFGIYGSTSKEIIPGTVKPMVYQDGDGTWEPYTGGKPSPSMEYKQDPESSGDGGELEVKVKNSNLLGGEELAKKIVESGGTRSGNLVSFMCEKSRNSILFSDFEDDAEYTLILYGMCKNTQYSTTNLSVTYNDSLSGGSVGQFTKKGEFSYCVHKIRSGAKRLLIVWDSTGTDIDITKSGLFKGQVDLSDFIESNTQTFSLQTSNGLPGLPIDSGGNYTDSNGQQWVCDEMDFGRGKYVQRIKKVVFNGSEEWALQSINGYGIANFATAISKSRGSGNVFILSSHFREQKTVIAETKDGDGIFLTAVSLFLRFKKERISTVTDLKAWLKENPVTVIYDLAYPIETDIPEETMTAYRNLYTSYPSTVIQNDSGAGMEVEYVADTKQFILDQIKALVQA